MDLILCNYCNLKIVNDDYLLCCHCNKNIHIKCLKRPGTPGDLFGDVFFTFTCINCSNTGKEIFLREKMTWLIAIVLAIYNLTITSNGLSHYGYFHWRTHIANFIEKNWCNLFPSSVTRKKKWIGNVSGSLSHHRPYFFKSGLEVIKEAGWWKLTHNQTPKFYSELYENYTLKKQQKDSDSPSEDIILDSENLNQKEDNSEEEVFSRTLPYMGKNPRSLNRSSGDIVDIETDLLPPIKIPKLEPLTDLENVVNFLDYDIANTDFLDAAININIDETLLPNLSEKTMIDFFDKNNYTPRIVQVTNYQETDYDINDTNNDINVCFNQNSNFTNNNSNNKKINDSELSSDNDDSINNQQIICEKSLFNVTVKREYPWNKYLFDKNNEENDRDDHLYKNIVKMNAYDEYDLLKKLKVIINNEFNSNNKIKTIPAWINRIYRKLVIRKLKTKLNKPLLDIDNMNTNGNLNIKKINLNILDRYSQLITNNCNNNKEDTSFLSRLAGNTQLTLFESPYTGRILQPFIYRNTKSIPTWVKIMCDLQYQVNGILPKRSSIDYCYVRPQHIAAINALLQRMFWPGIDMSDCLTYPDFSIVALYKKLIIGCAFLVPDVGHNEAYVSFMVVRPGWQRAGIATFMLYHLTQTCMGKDITLHVSATNPAICLYQKFGFKIEKVILDFYDKYLTNDSLHSRHAFLLRLCR